MNQQQFNQWLDTFIKEKGIDTERVIEVEGDSGTNHIPVGVLIEHMHQANAAEQMLLHDKLVRLDFYNQSIDDFLDRLANAIAQ